MSQTLVTALRPQYPSIVDAEGGYFTVADGRRFMDLSAQTLNLALGHCFPSVTQAAYAQAQRVEFASSRFATQPFLELSERLAQITPHGLDAVALKLTNGSDAVETAVKLAFLHTRRSKIGCLPGAWHGESFLSLGFSSTHYGRLLSDSTHAVMADTADISALTRLVQSRRDLAGVILDPTMVAHGLPAGDIHQALAELRAACHESGTLLIFDEIQSFGWLGSHLFISDLTGVCPDIICLGKALGAGYPLAAVVARSDLAAVLQYNDAEFTSGGHPVACAAALAGLDAFFTAKSELSERVDLFAELLTKAFTPEMFAVRTLGLIATVTLAENRLCEAWTSQVISACTDVGLFVRATDSGRRLLIKPPIVLPLDDVQTGISTLADICAEKQASLQKPTSITSATEKGTLSAGAIIRKPVRPNPHAGYVAALAHVAGPQLQVGTRSAQSQEHVTHRLSAIGIPTARTYAVDGENTVEHGYVPGQPLHAVLADPHTDTAWINGLVLRHYELITRAHDHGIIIGDRWPGNAIVTPRAEVVFIDFELGYTGPQHVAALFEETFSVLQTLIVVRPDYDGREDLMARLVEAVTDRHGIQRARDAWQRLEAFYADPARPVHPESDPAEKYTGVLSWILACLQ